MYLTQSRTRNRRLGFTLIELMVVMVLLSIVVGGLVKVIAGQQRFYRSAGDLMDSRSQIRQAVTLLPADLRGASGGGGDIVEATDISLQIMANIASSAVCSATANTFTVPPLTLASGQTISAGRTLPAVGDVMMVYDEGLTAGRTDDLWQRHTITGTAATVGACVSPFTTAADLLRQSFVYTITPAVSATVPQGGPVRFLRRVTYQLYLAGDGNWYLGYAECPNNVCGALQPVAGPYQDYVGANNATNGLQFRYFNANNVEFAAAALTGVGNQPNRNWIARVQITVRGETASALAMPGLPAAPKKDTLIVQVGLRNRQ